jgi:hypothetical protein
MRTITEATPPPGVPAEEKEDPMKNAEPLTDTRAGFERIFSGRGEEAQKGRRLRKEETPTPSEGKTPKHPPRGEVHGRRGREVDPTPEAERALEGSTPGG